MKPLIFFLILFLLLSCESKQSPMEKIIFLHHSTGQRIWIGKTNRYVYKFTKRNDVESSFKKIIKKNGKKYSIKEQSFPAESLYGWKNYPYDYYNIWVKNAGEKPYMNEPTLEILTKEYDIIIFKHCFPVSKIMEDTGTPNIDSEERGLKIINYSIQH